MAVAILLAAGAISWYALGALANKPSETASTTSSSQASTQQITSSQTSSSTSSATSSTSTTLTLPDIPLISGNSTTDSSDIRLSLSINATRLEVGQTLAMNATLSSISPGPNSESVSNDTWAFEGVPIAFWGQCMPDPHESTPLEIVVLNGYYTSSNITSIADHPFLYAAGPCMEFGAVHDIILLPNSFKANLTEDAPDGVGDTTYGPVNTTAIIETKSCL